MKRTHPTTHRNNAIRVTARHLPLLLGGTLAGLTPAFNVPAQDAAGAARLEKLERENETLRARLDSLESIAQREGILPSGNPTQVVKALSDMTLSGFVSASYFYDFSEPPDGSPNGYLWNRNHNSFTLNKVKLTLASQPVEASGETWDVGYRVSLIFGEDAPIVNTGGEFQGFEALREAYIDLNVPIGTGLNVKIGQLISLLNFESGDGGVANPNFSQGNQWYFTGNGPSAGLQLGYALSDCLDVKVRVQNGMFTGAIDNNGYKTLMGSVGWRPDTRTSLSLIGFGGREGASSDMWLKGGSVIASRLLSEKHKLNAAAEFDYFNTDTFGGSSEWWSIGGWLWADFTEKVGAAIRADYISDPDGAGTSGLLGFGNIPGQDLVSVTLTLNVRPIAGLKFQPQIRYDHTSSDGAFDGADDRFIVGMGASYSF